MMQIVYFSHKTQFLEKSALIEGQKLFITPSPLKADALRSKIGVSFSTDVITIAKFTSELMKIFWNEGEAPEVKRKSELLLIFGILRNKYFPDIIFEQFKEAYNLFSDLRSFTLDFNALDSVLEEETAATKRMVQLFWTLLDSLGHLDEHAAYQVIAEKLRSSEEESSLKKTFIFWGFQHLNGQQLDLIKALSIRYHVLIPIPLPLKEKLKRSDWMSWLLEHRVEVIEYPEVQKTLRATLIPTNSRELAITLKTYLKPKSQVILGVSKLSMEHVDLVPSAQVGFKVAHSLIEAELLELADELFEDVVEGALALKLDDWLVDQKLKIKKNKEIPFKKLKALQLYEEVAIYLKEVSDEEIVIDPFFQKLLREVTLLNQPRASMIPLSKEHLGIELKDMSTLEDVDKSRPIFICLDDRFNDIQGLGQNYPENIRKALSSIGPLKRNDLDLAYKQWEFEEVFDQSDVFVLMERSILKHSIIWKKLFSKVEFTENNFELKRESRMIRDVLSNKIKKSYQGNFSASRLQSYIDCPRRFYYSYVDDSFPEVQLKQDIDALLAGTIVHKIIEEFYLRSLSDQDIPALTHEIFTASLESRSLKLAADVFEQRKLIFQHRTQNGISFLGQIESILNEKVVWKVEQDFKWEENFKISGKIDCLGVSSRYVFLLDFKSSKASASSFQEVESMESLQLWVYSLAAQKIIPDFSSKTIVIGYVVLDDPEESNLLMMDSDLLSMIKAQKFSKVKSFKNDFVTSLDEFKKVLATYVKNIQEEVQYLPNPRKESNCQFCYLNQVCIKGDIKNV